MPDEPVLQLQNMENTSCAYQQIIHPTLLSGSVESPRVSCYIVFDVFFSRMSTEILIDTE